MGCGASKAAVVANTDITTKKKPNLKYPGQTNDWKKGSSEKNRFALIIIAITLL